MNSSKMRPILLSAFLLVTSLVIAKAGLEWTRDDAPVEETVVTKDEQAHDKHMEHMEHLERLKENEARLREHAEALAEKIASNVDVKVKIHADPDVRVRVHTNPEVRVEVDREDSEDSGYSYSYNYDYDYDYDFDFDTDEVGEMVMHESFDTSPGADLIIQVPGADLQVVSGRSDVAEIFVFLEADNMSKAHDYFADLNFEIKSDGNDIIVTAESNSDWGWSGHGDAHITVRAQIPSQFNADLSTSGGDVLVAQLNGRLTLATSGGDIELGAINGDGIKVTTSGGDIEAGALNGPMKLTTSGGDIELGAVNGPEVYVTTSGGDIEMGAVSGDEITVKTSGGDIEVGHVQGESTVVKTSGGDIEVGNLASDLEASTSGGDISVHMSKAFNVDLSTTGGSIDIVAPGHAGAELILDAGEVYMSGSGNFSGTREEDRIEGELNGGGPTIRATANHGEINLHIQ
jgi:hypothetical protein